MNDTSPEQLPAWERDLRGLPVTEQERAELDQQAADEAERQTQAAAEEAARREGWPLLHHVADGATVNLNPIWPQLEPERWDLDPVAVVELLAERAGGVGRRLLAGVQSLLARRDGNTDVWIDPKPEEGLVEVIGWSLGGCWTRRAWWVRCIFEVDTDAYGELRLASFGGTTLAVRGEGDTTVFVDDEQGLLGKVVGRWYLAWLGRRAVREQFGLRPIGPQSAAVTLEDFLTSDVTAKTFTLTVVEGEQPYSNGVDLADPTSPISYTDLPPEVQQWLADKGYDTDRPDVWVLVTPADEPADARNVIDSREVII